MSQSSHTTASGGSSGSSTTNITSTTDVGTADANVAQLLIEAVSVLKKIEYHLSLMTDTDLSNTEI